MLNDSVFSKGQKQGTQRRAIFKKQQGRSTMKLGSRPSSRQSTNLQAAKIEIKKLDEDTLETLVSNKGATPSKDNAENLREKPKATRSVHS